MWSQLDHRRGYGRWIERWGVQSSGLRQAILTPRDCNLWLVVSCEAQARFESLKEETVDGVRFLVGHILRDTGRPNSSR